MTLVDVAAVFDLTKQAVSHWETGRIVPTAEQVAILAAEFGVSVEWLITGNDAWPFGSDATQAEVASLPPELLQQVKGMLRLLLLQAGGPVSVTDKQRRRAM